ncbi:DNA mismatch repair endonuclease MutL [uncultured Eudoraea sp.]|uniref:DNA mismatch repair endonuclease MutL n=1 Tax=uncultured Eudoraea sp. TaxID=1035614 RepID=UPI0026396410|nr:DNA mismatch repair endonuclease MutL [uncultured Eudoraea sp.]
MADIIQLLPDHVANQIAAGEVVQRPASVVKELLENAIDAGATTIKLIVKDGGKTLIKVVDDGKGMSVTDARLSFERHATSKINCAEDLFHLDTKGFRGEALASIAAIAHVDMHTCLEEEEVGTHIKIEGSKVLSQEVTVKPKGTSVSVKNLFFNIPARRKFLKSNQVELRHITDEFHRVALAHPTVQFYFYNNGGELFNLPPSNFRKRIVHIFGFKTKEKLVPVTEETKVVKVSGFVFKPEYAKKSRGQQFFFVNKRFIKSHYLHHAVMASFEGLLRPDTSPGYFLYLDVEPSSIDINIHPTKTEIKFDDEHTLYAILKSTIKHSLGQFNVSPVLDFDKDQNLDTPYMLLKKQAHQPGITIDHGFNPFRESGFEKSAGRSMLKPSSGDWESMYVGLESKVGMDESFSTVHLESDTITGSIFEETQGEVGPGATTFQFRRKYIVSTIKSGMLIIHQGRAHQRVLYEKFLKSITVKETLSQQLLFPLKLNFSKEEISVLEEIKGSLTSLGFSFGRFTEDELQINGIPQLVNEAEVGIVLDQLISDYQMEVNRNGFTQSEVLSKVLCKSLAVKTGEILNFESQQALVNALFACKETKRSPFNKLVYITITGTEIDNKFI